MYHGQEEVWVKKSNQDQDDDSEYVKKN